MSVEPVYKLGTLPASGVEQRIVPDHFKLFKRLDILDDASIVKIDECLRGEIAARNFSTWSCPSCGELEKHAGGCGNHYCPECGEASRRRYYTEKFGLFNIFTRLAKLTFTIPEEYYTLIDAAFEGQEYVGGLQSGKDAVGRFCQVVKASLESIYGKEIGGLMIVHTHSSKEPWRWRPHVHVLMPLVRWNYDHRFQRLPRQRGVPSGAYRYNKYDYQAVADGFVNVPGWLSKSQLGNLKTEYTRLFCAAFELQEPASSFVVHHGFLSKKAKTPEFNFERGLFHELRYVKKSVLNFHDMVVCNWAENKVRYVVHYLVNKRKKSEVVDVPLQEFLGIFRHHIYHDIARVYLNTRTGIEKEQVVQQGYKKLRWFGMLSDRKVKRSLSAYLKRRDMKFEDLSLAGKCKKCRASLVCIYAVVDGKAVFEPEGYVDIRNTEEFRKLISRSNPPPH